MESSAIVFVDDGIVLGGTCKHSTQSIKFDRVNEFNVVMYAFNDVVARNYFQQHLQNPAVQNMSFQDLMMHVSVTLNTFVLTVPGSFFSIVFAGYSRNYESQSVACFHFNGQQLSKVPYNPTSGFTDDVTLGSYFALKIYRSSISLELAKTFVGFVLFQNRIVLRDISNRVDIATLTPNGFQRLDQNEIMKIETRCRGIDSDLRKDFADLFLRDSINNKGITK